MLATHPKLIKVQFESVPVLTRELLEAYIDGQQELHPDPRLRGFGAYLIHNADEDLAIDCFNFMANTEVDSFHAEYKSVTNRPMHMDLNSLFGTTVHHTVTGSLEFIIFIGTVNDVGFNESLIDSVDDSSLATATAQLFGSDILDPNILPEPTRALKTKVSAGDMLLFEHEQPHAFRSLSEDRYSQAYFLESKA